MNPAHRSPIYVLPSAVAVFWIACGIAVSALAPEEVLSKTPLFSVMGDFLISVVPQIGQLAAVSSYSEKVITLFIVLVLASPVMIYHFWSSREHLFSLLTASISPVAGLSVCLVALAIFVWLVVEVPLPPLECGAKSFGRGVPIMCTMRLSSVGLGLFGTMIVVFVNLTLTATWVFASKIRHKKRGRMVEE